MLLSFSNSESWPSRSRCRVSVVTHISGRGSLVRRHYCPPLPPTAAAKVKVAVKHTNCRSFRIFSQHARPNEQMSNKGLPTGLRRTRLRGVWAFASDPAAAEPSAEPSAPPGAAAADATAAAPAAPDAGTSLEPAAADDAAAAGGGVGAAAAAAAPPTTPAEWLQRAAVVANAPEPAADAAAALLVALQHLKKDAVATGDTPARITKLLPRLLTACGAGGGAAAVRGVYGFGVALDVQPQLSAKALGSENVRGALRGALSASAESRETICDDAALVKLAMTQRSAAFTSVDFWRRLAASGRRPVSAQHLPALLRNWAALVRENKAGKYLLAAGGNSRMRTRNAAQVRGWCPCVSPLLSGPGARVPTTNKHRSSYI